MSLEIGSWLAPEGALSEALPDYEDRPAQRAMAGAVADALAGARSLLVEAGTGTGKTFAYLVPALASGLKVVVSTGTRTLQEQIARRDLPRLEAMLGRPLSAVTLKGIANYVCQRRLAEAAATMTRTADGGDARLAEVLAWARRSTTGDRAELDAIDDRAPVWGRVTTTADARLGPRCPEFERCFVTRARRAADKADLVLVNHHLFFADLALRNAFPGARVLPDYDAVIFDEAHQLEAVITEHMGIGVSTVRLASWLREVEESLGLGTLPLFGRRIDPAAPGMVAAVRRAGDRFFAEVGRAITALGGRGERVALPPDLFGRRATHEVWLGLDNAVDELALLLAGSAEVDSDEDRAEAARALARRGERLRDDLAAIAEHETDARVHWGEVNGGRVLLQASPIEVDDVLPEQVAVAVPAVLTSATLTSGGSFDYLRERLGLTEEHADALSLASPFDYARQALLYIARDLPEPRDIGFTAACTRRIVELLAITGGSAFVLFTSHRALAEVAGQLAGQVEYPLLVQGQQARAGLLESFRTTPGAVLLATGGFWEGVDVPGDALSQVIIDKLPFAPPTDPLVGARMRRIEERGGDPFNRYQLPQAALALKQGFGRLIRRADDRGLVSVLDGRLVSRRYGRTFVASLPAGLQRTSSLERARRWWSQT